MLTFDGDMEGLYEDFFPVVWRYVRLHLPVTMLNLATFQGHHIREVGWVFLFFCCRVASLHMVTRTRSIQGSGDLHEPVRQTTLMQRTCNAYPTFRLAFSKPQVVDGNIIDASTCVKINVSSSDLLHESWHRRK
jgi:hypothetical protein